MRQMEIEDKEYDLAAWRKLTFDQKRYIIYHQWLLDYEKVGCKLRDEILEAFKNKIKDIKGSDYIKNVGFGWYGFDTLLIVVIIEKGKKVRLPRIYDEVFPIKKIYK